MPTPSTIAPYHFYVTQWVGAKEEGYSPGAAIQYITRTDTYQLIGRYQSGVELAEIQLYRRNAKLVVLIRLAMLSLSLVVFLNTIAHHLQPALSWAIAILTLLVMTVQIPLHHKFLKYVFYDVDESQRKISRFAAELGLLSRIIILSAHFVILSVFIFLVSMGSELSVRFWVIAFVVGAGMSSISWINLVIGTQALFTFDMREWGERLAGLKSRAQIERRLGKIRYSVFARAREYLNDFGLVGLISGDLYFHTEKDYKKEWSR